MSSSWWDKKLGVPQAPAPTTQPSYIPQPTSYPQQGPVQLPPSQSYPPPTPAIPMGTRCPSCGSGNYVGGHAGVGQGTRERCFDCGYPIQQSGSGLGKGISGPRASGPATPAKQIATPGFNGTTPAIGPDGGFI